MIAALCALLLPAVSPCLDQAGKSAGDQHGRFAIDRLGNKSGLEQRSKLPMTNTTSPLRTFNDSQQQPAAAFCGQDTVKNQAQAFSVTVLPTQVTVASDTNSDGFLDNTSAHTMTRICRDGFCDGSSCYTWTVGASGVVGVSGVASLDGCMDPADVPPTYAGGKIARLYAEATGRTITKSATGGSTATYFSGQVTDCANQPRNITQTKYYDNPYTMQDDGIASQFTPCAPGDSYCQGYKAGPSSVRNAYGNFSGTTGSGIGVCDITRDVIDAKGPQGGIICEAKKLYYASGYSDQSMYCMSNPASRWDYTSMFRVRCDAYGRGMTLEGWASWEGAPCGTTNTGNFPPPNQVTRPLVYGGSSSDVVIGRLSVNRRISGDNVAYNDLDVGAGVCYSQQMPLNVHLSHMCGVSNEYCTYQVEIDNAHACNSFAITVAPPAGEQILDGCRVYEETAGCKLTQERWFNANNNSVFTMQNSAPTHNTLAESCKTLPTAGTVCKPWWKKERTYSCAADSDPAKKQPDISRAVAVSFTADDLGGSSVKFARSSHNVENTPTCRVEITDSFPSATLSECLSLGGQSSACPEGYTDSGNICMGSPICEGGSLNPAMDFCEIAPSPACPTGYSLDATTTMCRMTPQCLPGAAYNPTADRCEKPLSSGCIVLRKHEVACVYADPVNKTNLHCDTAGIPISPEETRRVITRDCLEMRQCEISCVVRVPDASAPSGFVSQTIACTDNGNNVYSCPNGTYGIEKDCDCIIDTWDPAITKGDDCEVGCLVSMVAPLSPDSNVKKDYLVKTCTKTIVGNAPSYTCPAVPGETIQKDCACVDTFGMTVGVLGALEQAIKDRNCE